MSLPDPYQIDDDLVPPKVSSFKDVQDEYTFEERIAKNISNSNNNSSIDSMSLPEGGVTSGQKRRNKGEKALTKKSKKRIQPGKDEPPPGPNDMSRKELKEWKSWYETQLDLENYLRMEAEDPENLMDNFYKTLSRMMMCMYNADEFFENCYLEQYRWEHRGPSTPGEENHRTDPLQLERGALLMLQIKDALGVWQDWLYLAKSNYGGVGIFTARAFPKKALLGLYVGPEVWRASRPGTPEPSSEDLTKAGVPDSLCLCSIRNPDGLMLVLRPERVEIGFDPQPIYLGMHWAKGKEEPEVPPDISANCEIVEDGGIVAHVALGPHEELVCGVLEYIRGA